MTLEFTGVFSLYKADKPIQASFRYPTTYRRVKNNDRICLVQEGAVSTDQSLASVKVGNPSGHWLDEQGCYKSGKAVLDISKVELPSDEAQYMLLYVGKRETGSEEILARSKVFTVCPKDSLLDGYSCQSLEDQLVLVNKVPNSLDSSEALSDISINGSFNHSYSPAQPSSSFVVVSENDSHKQESEVLSVLEDVELKSESGDLSIPEDFDLLVTVAKQNSASVPLLIESEPWTQPSETGEPISRSDRPIPKQRTYAKLKEKSTNTESKGVPRETNEVGVQVESPSPQPAPTVDKMGVSSTDLDFELLHSPESVDMSASVNLGAAVVSQREARMFKSANKEQRLKIKKLTSRMEEMIREIVTLKEKLKDVDVQIVRELEKELEQIKEEKERILYQLTEEKGALEQKASQLQLECSTLFERCTTLLTQLQEKETESTILASENLVLREKVKYLEEKLKKTEHKHHKKEREQESKKVKPKDPVVRDLYKPQPQKKVTDVPAAATIPDKQQSYPTVELIPQRNRPTNLPLGSNDNVKPASLPKLALVSTKNRSHSSTRNSAEPRPQATEKIDSGKSHPYPHRAVKKIQAVPTPKPTTSEARSQHSQYSHHRATKKTDTESRTIPKFSQDPTTTETRTESLSEERIEEIASQLRGAPVVVCPVCQKVLHARENDYSVLLHVEYCLKAQH